MHYIVQQQWLYGPWQGNFGSIHLRPLALRDRYTHKVYSLFPNLSNARAAELFAIAREF